MRRGEHPGCARPADNSRFARYGICVPPSSPRVRSAAAGPVPPRLAPWAVRCCETPCAPARINATAICAAAADCRPNADPSTLFVLRRGFRWGSFRFALSRLLVLLSLFFLASRARCPVSFLAVSPVIRFECHVVLFQRVDRLV